MFSIWNHFFTVNNENDRTFYSGSREDLLNDNDVSLNDVMLEERDELSEASSLGGSTTSLSTSDISPQWVMCSFNENTLTSYLFTCLIASRKIVVWT